MATQIYIKDESKEKLNVLCDHEHRAIVDEIGFLIDKRMVELGLEVKSEQPS